LKDLYFYIFFISINVSAQAQHVRLLKTTLGSAGGSFSTTLSGTYNINQTIGQSSLTRSFSAGSIRLLQGFQHPNLSHSVTSYSNQNRLTIYPNPSTGLIHIIRENDLPNETLTISLFDVLGHPIAQEKIVLASNPLVLNYTTIPKGMYTLRMAGNKTGIVSFLLFLQ